MKIIFALIYIFLVSINTFALEEQRVTGFASCQKTGDLKILAIQDAMEKCHSPILRITEWVEKSTPCSGLGPVEWDGLSIEAVFACQHAGADRQVVTNGSARDFRPYAFEEAMNQATDSAKKICHSDVKLIHHNSATSGCLEGVCTVNVRALFECLFLTSDNPNVERNNKKINLPCCSPHLQSAKERVHHRVRRQQTELFSESQEQ